MSRRHAVYEDGLDEYGYPIPVEPCFVYKRGSEEDAGDFRPISIADAAASLLARLHAVMEIGGNCESPIELQIGAAILMFFERAGHDLKLCKMIDRNEPADGLVLVPQFAWSYYRSDWAILNPKRHGALLIECDGKVFHSSPDQKAHDARKDAAALERGFLTMRFTGSQIHRDADGCAQKIFDAVLGE